MRADWLLMKDVREELIKLRSRLFERTGGNDVFESLLVDAWDEVCRSIEDERALNGGNRVRSLRTSPALKPDLHVGSGMLSREVGARNYVGRPKWDILVDRILRGKLEEWTKFPHRQLEMKVAEFRVKSGSREESPRAQESPPSPPSSASSSPSR